LRRLHKSLWLSPLLFSACAMIPGSDVPIPANRHEGWELAACLSLEHRDEACCYYKRSGAVKAICTSDGGAHWAIVAPEDYQPPVQAEEPEGVQSL